MHYGSSKSLYQNSYYPGGTFKEFRFNLILCSMYAGAVIGVLPAICVVMYSINNTKIPDENPIIALLVFGLIIGGLLIGWLIGFCSRGHQLSLYEQVKK